MIHYKKILVAVDFSRTANKVIERAAEIEKNSSSKLTLLHVVDHLPPLGFGEEPLIAPDWMIPEKELTDSAEKSILRLKQENKLTNAAHLVTVGTASSEIVRVAEEGDYDLIVVGSHGRHGISLLLGSTANGVLHHATCDVLAVRVSEKE